MRFVGFRSAKRRTSQKQQRPKAQPRPGGRPKPALPRKPAAQLPTVRCRYAYDAQDVDELSFNEGDVIEVLKEGEWASTKVGGGRGRSVEVDEGRWRSRKVSGDQGQCDGQ